MLWKQIDRCIYTHVVQLRFVIVLVKWCSSQDTHGQLPAVRGPRPVPAQEAYFTHSNAQWNRSTWSNVNMTHTISTSKHTRSAIYTPAAHRPRSTVRRDRQVVFWHGLAAIKPTNDLPAQRPHLGKRASSLRRFERKILLLCSSIGQPLENPHAGNGNAIVWAAKKAELAVFYRSVVLSVQSFYRFYRFSETVNHHKMRN